jgi:hypothetical protein
LCGMTAMEPICRSPLWGNQFFGRSNQHARLTRTHLGTRYCTLSFKSVVTCHAPPCRSRTLVEVTRLSGLVEPSGGHAGPQIAQKAQKRRKFRFKCPNFEVSRKNSAAAEM